MPETVSSTFDPFTLSSQNNEAPNMLKLLIPIDFFAVIFLMPETVSYKSDYTVLSQP